MSAASGRFALWGPVAAYMALIFAGSSVSSPPQVGPDVSDKALHLVVYAGLCVVIVRALTRGWIGPMTAGVVLRGALLSTVYGASDELHQAFVPQRQMEALDLLADAAGAAIAASVLWAWGIIRERDGL